MEIEEKELQALKDEKEALQKEKARLEGEKLELEKSKGGIPKARLDQEIEKRKAMEKELEEIANELKADVPDKFKDLIPDLPPKALIQWLRKANREGLFVERDTDVKGDLDSKRPDSKKKEDLESLSPYQKMARGYKTK